MWKMDDKIEMSIKLGLKRDDTNDFFVERRDWIGEDRFDNRE